MNAPHSSALAAVTTPRPPAPHRAKACEKLARMRPPGEPQYFREAFVHPANIAVLTLPIALAVLSQSAWILLPGLFIEIAFVALLAKLRPFRRRVDEAHRELERDAAAAARAEIFDGMSDRHRREFITLENRVAHIRDRVALGPSDDALGLRRLLAGYLKLALAHKQAYTALQMSDRAVLSAEIERLERLQTTSSSRVRSLERRRLALARQRAVVWDRNRENLAMIETQLATIADVVHLIHDRSIAPLESETLERDIEQLLTDLEASEKALEELGEVSGEDPPDVESLTWLTAPRPAAP
jgi:hypothetical protein